MQIQKAEEMKIDILLKNTIFYFKIRDTKKKKSFQIINSENCTVMYSIHILY